jgi:hypothetical protein
MTILPPPPRFHPAAAVAPDEWKSRSRRKANGQPPIGTNGFR